MKALGVLESKWDPIRKKLARGLIEEQDKALRSYFAQKGGTRNKGGDMGSCKGWEHVRLLRHVCVKKARADRDRVIKSWLSREHGFFSFLNLSLVKSSC
jgi:hypothetical protein